MVNAIDGLTIGEAKQLMAMLEGKVCDLGPYKAGQAVLIRTVTHYYTGRIVEVYQHELVLEDVAWIADTGRFGDALAKGNLSEIEPMPGRVIVSRGGIIDCADWPHALPKEQK